jgi:hypothetical protein
LNFSSVETGPIREAREAEEIIHEGHEETRRECEEKNEGCRVLLSSFVCILRVLRGSIAFFVPFVDRSIVCGSPHRHDLETS